MTQNYGLTDVSGAGSSFAWCRVLTRLCVPGIGSVSEALVRPGVGAMGGILTPLAQNQVELNPILLNTYHTVYNILSGNAQGTNKTRW